MIKDHCSAHCKGAGQGAGDKVPRAYGGNAEGLLRTRRAQNTIISILARNQARRHWVYSGNYPEHLSPPRAHKTQKPNISQKTLGVFWKLSRTFAAPRSTRNAETKRQSGAVPIPLLALLALMTRAYSSLGVSRESNPRHQLLKALV